jgi:hypothetical protein
MVLKLEHFGKYMRNTLKVLKCCGGKGRRGLVGTIVWRMKKYYTESRGKRTFYLQWNEKSLSGLGTCCVGTAFCNRIEGTGRRGERCKQLTNDLKENRSCWKLKEVAKHSTLWINGFGRCYGPLVRQTTLYCLTIPVPRLVSHRKWSN